MSQLIRPLILLLIILKSSRQNERQTAAGENIGDISRTDRSALYHELFETNGAPQQKEKGEGQKMDEKEAVAQKMHWHGHGHQRQQREGGAGARGTTTTPKSRGRYLEFAETEFSRPSSYLPVPFVAPANNRLQTIPARTLSQLIRQHIARNRMKQLTSQNPTDHLQSAQSLVKEFRQTPFRRWPSNSTILSYAEKRRQWKTELKRRLKEQKVRTRVIPPLLISGGGFSSIITDREPENRYYVTYSPQTRTYQVSRHPPPFLYTTDQDTLPQQLDEEQPQQVQAEGQHEEEEERTGEEEQAQEENPSEAPPPTANNESAATGTQSPLGEKHLETSAEESSTTAMPTTTTVRPSLLVILQNAELMAKDGQRHSEQSQRVEAKKTEQQRKPLKQILFLDDYEQVQGHEEGGREGQSQEGEGDAFEEEEDEEEDEVFFFKPSGASALSGEGSSRDPFRIVVHETGKKL